MAVLDSKVLSHVSYLSLGSNMQNREKNLIDAILMLAEQTNIQMNNISHFYETEPQNFQAQSDFFNCVIKIDTTLNPYNLLSQCQQIENLLGRIYNFKYGPRVIDIDILLYDNLIINDTNLTIPHPELINRNFMLTPLIELFPNSIIKEKPASFWQTICSSQKIRKLPIEPKTILEHTMPD